MLHSTTSGHHNYPIDEGPWILAGIIILIAFGDALVLLAAVFAIVTMTTAWWIHHKVEHRVERNDAELAPVTHLRPALTGQRDLEKTSAHASWRGPSAGLVIARFVIAVLLVCPMLT